MLQLQNMTIIEFLLESGVCIYVYHTRCYLMRSILWCVCKKHPVNSGAFVVHGYYSCCISSLLFRRCLECIPVSFFALLSI